MPQFVLNSQENGASLCAQFAHDTYRCTGWHRYKWNLHACNVERYSVPHCVYVCKLVCKVISNSAIKIVHTTPWPRCPNRNVFSDHQNPLYDKSAYFRCDGRLFHSLGPAAANALWLNVLYVRACMCVGSFPLMLSIESHCSIKQQQTMAYYMRQVLGSKLHVDEVDVNMRYLQSPDSLRGKILIKVQVTSSDTLMRH